MEMIRNVKLPDKLAETFGLSRISASSVASRILTMSLPLSS